MKRELEYRALSAKVLAVASINRTDDNEIFDWACYIDSVMGQNHEYEKKEVARNGSKQKVSIAHAIFPNLDLSKYRE